MHPVEFLAVLSRTVELQADAETASKIVRPVRDLTVILRNATSLDEVTNTAAELDRVSRKIFQLSDEMSDEFVAAAAQMRPVSESARRFAALLTANVKLQVRNPVMESEALADDVSLTFQLGQLIDKKLLEHLHGSSRSILEILRPDVEAHRKVLEYGQHIEQSRFDYFAEAIGILREIATDPNKFADLQLPPVVRTFMAESMLRRLDLIEAAAKKKVDSIGGITTAGGQKTLSEAFDNTKVNANWGAWAWTLGVFASVAAGIGLPLWALSKETALLAALPDLAGVILKVAVGLPLFALAAYCGHVAAQHRDTARHMNILSAQLNSVHAYSNELPDDKRLELLMLLGKRAFSDPNLLVHDKGKVTLLPEDVTELLKKLADMVAANQKPTK